MYQNHDGNICESRSNIHKNIKALAILFTDERDIVQSEDMLDFVYTSKTQHYLRKNYLSVICHEKYLEKQRICKEREQIRDQTRDQTPKRKKDAFRN